MAEQLLSGAIVGSVSLAELKKNSVGLLHALRSLLIESTKHSGPPLLVLTTRDQSFADVLVSATALSALVALLDKPSEMPVEIVYTSPNWQSRDASKCVLMLHVLPSGLPPESAFAFAINAPFRDLQSCPFLGAVLRSAELGTQ